ncbi:galactoside 2-alpha-L-fucosyltransferase SEC1-like isoform X2 [Schistocerca gregaria]|uniref:galactoside 2-alpha-L-fucosyltransferase SEC1-like isoform X2 n=1 Tax=Schistocerca gregaria TaxID=7010 RepID=UPI00211E8D93|nr:galactoside 2-alpha-L-fucosyltransferase SEC1-like isoform X2 [Schistocerca gregaria]
MKTAAGGASAGSACRLVAASALCGSALALLLLLSVTERPPRAPVFTQEEEASRTIADPPQPGVERQALPAPVSCLSGVAVAVPAGRLGNLAVEYATAWAVARQHGLRLAVAEEMRRGLSAAFDGLTAAPLSALLRQPPCQRHNLSEEQVLHNEWYQLPSPAPPVQMVQWARRHHLPVVLRKHLFVPELAAAWLDELRKEFHFRPEVQMVADEKLNDARTQVAEMASCNRSQDRSPTSAVFLRSSKDAVDDLCLLASCEHTIISYGTFGTLAAMLAGGRVILYDMTQHGVRHRNPSSRIADYLPHWNALS